MHAILCQSVAIRQIHVKVIAFLSLEYEQILWIACSIPGPLLFKLYWIAFQFDDEKKPEAFNPPEEAQFKILVNGFDDPLTTLKLPGPQ